MKVTYGFARVTENEGAAGFEITKHVDDGALGVAGRDAHGAVVDVAVRFGGAGGVDTDRVALVVLRQHGDAARDRSGEQERAAAFRRRLEERLEFFAEAEVEHLVGFIEDGGLEFGEVEIALVEVIAETAGSADDDVSAPFKLTLLGAHAHAADALDDAGGGVGVEPFELAGDLHGEFARGSDDEGERLGRALKAIGVAEEG